MKQACSMEDGVMFFDCAPEGYLQLEGCLRPHLSTDVYSQCMPPP